MAEQYGIDPSTGRIKIHPDFWKDPGPNTRPTMGAPTPDWMKPPARQVISLPEWATSKLPTEASRDSARIALHGLARTGNTILKFLDIPNRVFGNTRSVLQDVYEKSEANLERDAYEDRGGAPQVAETAVHLASAGVLGKALPAVFGANVGADTYETAKYAGASEGEALVKGIGHGVVDTAIWTLGQGLASKYLPKAWQWLGRELTGAMRGAASSVTSDAMLNSLGADISGEEMAKRAVHAAWMVPLLGMLKMGGKRREEAMSLLRKARPDLAGAKADKVIETIEAEFSDPKSQKVALAWVARKGANLPDDTAQIRQALEVSSKVKGLDPMSRSPFEILSDPAYARYLPKPKPQDVKAFSNMKRYPMGVIGFDVSDDAAGRQATREMINAYMSPSSNPWCLATGKDAAKLGELGPGAEGYWKDHSAVPKQIFFQEVGGKLELTAFRATSLGGEGRQEYWDTSDAGYSGIPIKVKVPGDPMGRYQLKVFRPEKKPTGGSSPLVFNLGWMRHPFSKPSKEGDVVQGTFEDAAPGKIFKGDPFRDGHTQTWVQKPLDPNELARHKATQDRDPLDVLAEIEYNEREAERLTTGPDVNIYTVREAQDRLRRAAELKRFFTTQIPTGRESDNYVLVEDKERTTENGITKFRTTKYVDPTDLELGLYEGDESLKIGQPVEIEESELVSPEWMRARGYDPESEADVRRMQQDLNIQAWGNGVEAAMAVVPTKRTYMQTKSGTPETVTYGPNGRDVVSVDFEENGVPYREEYFNTGRYADQVSPELRSSGLDIAGPSYGLRDIGLDDVRLIRNPGGADAEVVSETRYDKDLGTFVRTVGNRRSYVAGQDISKEERDRASAYEDAIAYRLGTYGAGEGAYPAELPDGTVVMTRDQVRDLANMLRINAHRYTYPSYDFPMLAAFSENFPNAAAGIMSDLPTIRGGRIQTNRVLRTEDRQPDGTWVPVETSNIQTSPSRTNTLPPPPDEIPLWAQQGLTNEALREEMQYNESMERTLAEEEEEERGRRFNMGDDVDGDVPFALKAGRTRRNVRAAEGGGEATGSETAVSEMPVSEAPAQQGGPRIVINPTTFHNRKDALCVAFNEGFRLWMEANDFQPQSEPTDRQRKFFSDTAYADDELQLRRTILARVATFDTSVKDPTDDQLSETAQFLDGVLESGWCKNEWEQDCVSRLSQAVKAAIGAEPVEPREEPLEPAQAEPLEPAGGEEVQALQSGGSTDDEEEDRFALQNSGQSDRVDQEEDADLASREAEQAEGAGMQPEAQEQAQEPAADQGAPTVQPAPPDAPRAGETASPDDEPTEEQARQAEARNEKDLEAATKEYDRMKASGKLDNPRAFGEAARPKLTLASPVSQDSPGSIAYRGPRKGDISQPIVGSDSPGSIAYRGPRKGDISQPIVGSDSPGAISFSGARDRRPGQDDGVGGGIENPMVDPGSPGSISSPVLSYAPGSIESPVDDPRRKEERRKRRDRRRRGLL